MQKYTIYFIFSDGTKKEWGEVWACCHRGALEKAEQIYCIPTWSLGAEKVK